MANWPVLATLTARNLPASFLPRRPRTNQPVRSCLRNAAQTGEHSNHDDDSSSSVRSTHIHTTTHTHKHPIHTPPLPAAVRLPSPPGTEIRTLQSPGTFLCLCLLHARPSLCSSRAARGLLLRPGLPRASLARSAPTPKQTTSGRPWLSSAEGGMETSLRHVLPVAQRQRRRRPVPFSPIRKPLFPSLSACRISSLPRRPLPQLSPRLPSQRLSPSPRLLVSLRPPGFLLPAAP